MYQNITADISKFVTIGKFGTPFRIAGWVRIHSFMKPEKNIRQHHNCFIRQPKGIWRKVKICEIRHHGKEFIAKLSGIEDRDKAALLTKSELAISRDVLPKLPIDEQYWTDLLGLAVYNNAGVKFGIVKGLLETGANDVLVVQGVKEHLIPYISGLYILNVNLETKSIIVFWNLDS